MGRVFYTTLPGPLKLCLLALADHANDQGTSIRVGQVRLARKVGVTDRAIRSSVNRLVSAGYLVQDPRRGQRGVNRYSIVLSKLPSTTDIDQLPHDPDDDQGVDSRPEESSGRRSSTGSPASLDRKSSVPRPEVAASGEPSVKNHQKNHKSTIPDPFPLTDTYRDYDRAQGCTNPEAFHEHFVLTNGAKGYLNKNWHLARLNWSRDAHSATAESWKLCPCRRTQPQQRRFGERQTTRDIAREVFLERQQQRTQERGAL